MNRVSLIFFSILSALLFLSCEAGENDIAEFSEEEIIEGNRAIAAISEIAFADGDKSKIATEEEDIFYYLMDDQQQADEFVEAITFGNYNYDYYTLKLAADMGSLTIIPSGQDNCYFIIDFDIVTLPEVRYVVVNELFFE